MWDSIKITPLNSTIGYIHSNKYWKRKLSGVAINYILKRTIGKIVVNARYHENTFSLNFCNKYLKKSSKIIDIGSSESDFPLMLHASDFKVMAFDQRDYPFIESRKGEAGQISSYFANNSFDAITAISTIEHIGLGVYGDNIFNTSYFDLINEWKKLLRNERYLVITLPVTSSEKRREKGQWVENIMSFKNTIHNASGSIIEEKLVIMNDALPYKWEIQSINAKKDYALGVYMAGIKF
jgi:hypothetical protein